MGQQAYRRLEQHESDDESENCPPVSAQPVFVADAGRIAVHVLRLGIGAVIVMY